MWWWVLGAALAGESPAVHCPTLAREAVVSAAVEVERSWLDVDQPAFDVARNRLGRLTGCVDQELALEDAVLLHRARALIAVVDGDLDAARRSYAAVHALDPEWAPDPELVPREHKVWRAFEAAVDDDEDDKVIPFEQVPEHGWLVDGMRFPDAPLAPGETAHGLPGDRAFVLQLLGAGETITYTGYHVSHADVPVDAIRLAPRLAEYRKRRQRHARIASGVIGGALLAAGATTFALGWETRQGFEDQTLPQDPAVLDAEQAHANLLGGLGAGLGGAGALALTLGFAVPW